MGGGAGPTGVSATIDMVHSTVVVTDTNGCCNTSTPSQLSPIQDQDLVWVSTNSTACNSGGTATPTAEPASVSSNTMFSYPLPASCTAPSNITYIGVSQSWAVPYELPYKTALKAFWAAIVAHYGPNFTLPPGTNYFSKLNYIRFGGSVGSEWYPYCTSGGASGGLEMLGSPYKYTKIIMPPTYTSPPYTGWLNYYQEMGNYLQSLGPSLQVIHSINAAGTPTDYDYGTKEAGYAVTWSNRYGARDGFGSQGLSVQDYLNCFPGGCPASGSPNSASNWYPMFGLYAASGVPLELQPIALSYEGDTTCTTPYPIGCTANTYSGDLPTFLYPFATSAGATDVEIYWRDLSLAYDVNNYCTLNTTAPPPIYTSCNFPTSVTIGGQIPSVSTQNSFFQAVGQGDDPADCGSNTPQMHSTGTCAYATNINKAQGQH